MNTRHAVLFHSDSPFPNTSIMWIDGKRFDARELADPCYSLHSLAEAAYKHYVTHLWVLPGYGEFEPANGFDDWTFGIQERGPKGRKKMFGATARKRGHARTDVNIIFPQHSAWWPGWIQAVGAHDLLITIHYIEQVLGVTVGASPGRAGWNYLKKLHPEWIEEIPGVNWQTCHFTKGAATDIIWQRPLLATELGKQYVHKFDKAAAYPYAGSQTDVGVGTPVHVNHGYDARHEKGHPQSVGVWKCTVVDVPKVTTYDNMPPAWEGKVGKEVWLAGPVIRLLQSTGYNVGIDEGWVFPQRHDVLVKWAEDLWKFRQGFGDDRWVNKRCAEFARQGIKQIANQTVGLTAFKGFNDDDEMKRPDIRLQVIARHRELTWHNINKVRAIYGVTPVIVYMDAVYYLSNEPDGRKAFPELVKREGQFGGYRWEGRIPMEEAHIILDAKLSEAEKLEQFNQIGWIK